MQDQWVQTQGWQLCDGNTCVNKNTLTMINQQGGMVDNGNPFGTVTPTKNQGDKSDLCFITNTHPKGAVVENSKSLQIKHQLQSIQQKIMAHPCVA